MNKRLNLLATLAVIALLLAACGQSAVPEAVEEAPAAEAAAPAESAAGDVEQPVPEPANAQAEPAAEADPADAAGSAAVTDTAALTDAAPAEGATVADGAAMTDTAATEPEPAAQVRTFVVVPEQSSAQYGVEEEFFGREVPFVTTVGSTSAITGVVQLSFSGDTVALESSEFTVDLRTLASDQARRDSRIRSQWLESDTYPYAVFTATEVVDFPAGAAFGQQASFKLNGEMTIREITRPMTFDVTATVDGNTLTGAATGSLLMRDFGFEPPDIAGMLRVADGVAVTVNFTAVEQ